MTSPNEPVPGQDGTVGPFPSQYGRLHVYARDVHSGQLRLRPTAAAPAARRLAARTRIRRAAVIKATGGGVDGVPFLLLGLSAENCRRPVAGQPITVRADHVDPRLPALNVIVVGGETEDAIAAEVHAHIREGDR